MYQKTQETYRKVLRQEGLQAGSEQTRQCGCGCWHFPGKGGVGGRWGGGDRAEEGLSLGMWELDQEGGE